MNLSKISQVPALGNSRENVYTRSQFSKDLQVYHLASRHHPNDLYDGISNNFVKSIEGQINPSQQYSNKMKNLYMDQLDCCLHEYKNKMTRVQNQAEIFGKDYKENVNSVLLYMQKQNRRRKKFIDDYVKQQEQRQARFIDGDKIRNQKIQTYIRNNQFVLNLKPKQIVNSSTYQPDQLANSDLYQPAIQNTSIKLQNRPLKCFSQQNRFDSSGVYKIPDLEFNDRKTERENGRGLKKIYRLHNPITNPIQYHIDNPYFINKMQRKQGID